MHVILQDQENGRETVLCVDRRTNSCQILQLQPEHLATIEQIAKAMGAKDLYLQAHSAPPTNGWHEEDEFKIWVKEL